MFTTTEVRTVAVGGQLLRVAVRPGRGVGLPGRPRPGRFPLLLINGIGASLDVFQPFVDQLDPAIEVIRFDPPGVGGSPGPAGPYRFGGLCRLIAGMLAELGYDRVDVLGISWGGGVAQHFAAFQRSRCRRLVLVATGTGALMVPGRPSALVHMITPRRYLDPGYLGRVAGELYGGSARADPAGVAAMVHDGTPVGPRRGYLYQLTAGAGWTSVPFLPMLRQPTLILSGDDDPIIPLANARLMHALIRDSRLHVYHGGHLGLVTEAAELAPVVDAFLAAPSPSIRRPKGLLACHVPTGPPSPTPTSTCSSGCSTPKTASSWRGSGSSWRRRSSPSSATTGPGRSSPMTWWWAACASSASPARRTPGTAARAGATWWTA
jgi:poly(3-hydroxyalkanoate) depolymerase